MANRLYDRLYAAKDYAGEAERVRALVTARAPGATTLLDVACGTGTHLAELRRWFTVEGLDLDPELLALAAERLPGVPLPGATWPASTWVAASTRSPACSARSATSSRRRR